MDVLSFSAEFDDDKSAIEEQAEATLRSIYSVNRSKSSESSVRLPAVAAFVPPSEAKKRGRPPGSKNKPKGLNRQTSHSSSGARLSGSKRPYDELAAEGEHSAFAPPPVAQKGAYRFDASVDDVERSLTKLGIDIPAERSAVRSAIQGAGPGLIRAEDDSASFSRRYAVTHKSLYGESDCPICEETMAFKYHEARSKMGSGHKGADRLMSSQQRQKERMTRAIQARANLADADQKCHKVLYDVEHALRGRWNDKRLFRLLIVLRRDWIESKLEFFEIPYVPWTVAMLEKHYDPKNKHFDQPLRTSIIEYDRIQVMHEKLFEAALAGGNIDYRAVKELREYTLMTEKCRDAIQRRLDEGEPDIAEALRMLATAIAKTTQDTGAMKLMQDPETAAGKTKASLGVGEYEPHSNYVMSHLSAQ